ncbi:MAG TPA: hypothetical protein GX743_11875, partial [Actinomycetales bacterium]|nr:hypothetical protein [Actinomycetales bacterium]
VATAAEAAAGLDVATAAEAAAGLDVATAAKVGADRSGSATSSVRRRTCRG